MRPGRGRFQSLAAMFGFVLGLILLLGSLNLAIGIDRATRRGRQHAEYLLVNKRVSTAGMLTYIRPTFTEREIEDLRAQQFVVDVGEFTTNRFRASTLPGAGVSINDGAAPPDPNRSGMQFEMPLYTELFFESVPDRFLDVRPPNWEWSEDSDYLPIIMSREFLNLYNFSFALAQRLPQIPESLIGSMTGSVTVSGAGGRRTLAARVVGLSDRIPSIIVPEGFMQWANREIAGERQERPSRLIVKVDRPADPDMLAYFKQRNFQVNSERLRAGQVGRMAVLALTAVGAVGMAFVVLALLLFVLLSRLIIAEAGDRIRLLLQLGYAPNTLAACALSRFWLGLLIVALAAGAILGVALPFAYARLREVGLDLGSAWLPTTAMVGVLVLAATGLANLIVVRRSVARSCELPGR